MIPKTVNQLKWGITLLVFLSLGTKLYRLDQPPKFYFDEVYHGYTAVRYLHSESESYSPWGKHAEGMANEWTHPPLAKLIMAGFMSVFGENAFGWRVGSALFGTGAMLLTIAIGLELGLSILVVLLAGFLLNIEGLHFVQSRIAMNDSYFIFFELLTFLSYLKWRKKTESVKWLLITGVALGCAAATKWTTLWVVMILVLDTLIRTIYFGERLYPKKTPLWAFPVAFIVIPTLIYIGSYGQMFYLSGTWNNFIEVQKQMWWYHSGLKATHSYQSRPWQWIFDLRPVWMSANESTAGNTSNIYNLGNPIILWTGLVCILHQLFSNKAWTSARVFLMLCYFMLWVPWTYSPRIMLFYHYAPAIPFLCLLLALSLESLLNPKAPKKTPLFQNFPTLGTLCFLIFCGLTVDVPWALILGLALVTGAWNYLRTDLSIRLASFALILVASSVWYIVFFPHLIGIPVSISFADSVYFSLPGWR